MIGLAGHGAFQPLIPYIGSETDSEWAMLDIYITAAQHHTLCKGGVVVTLSCRHKRQTKSCFHKKLVFLKHTSAMFHTQPRFTTCVSLIKGAAQNMVAGAIKNNTAKE